ncbi:hypothetical protein JTE90_017313 [Oedothorax gibbosus]|uniref:Hflx-type G domain-containing protein n=1 Tax=Oedothorax gibbosus TaxID=931172 RepID=A0AAV6UCI8_9ARAC|nr:hypothetical protein JTE90_017313 [Oedothorax gibbosus]
MRNLLTLQRLLKFTKHQTLRELEIQNHLCTFTSKSYVPSNTKYHFEKLLISFNFCKKRTFICGSTALKYIGHPKTNPKNNLSDQSILDNFSQEIYHHPGLGHNILLIQPRIKYGPNYERKIDSECKLEEAVALVNTLPDWNVIEKCVLPVASADASLLFGKGNLDKIKEMIRSNPRISAVFVGIDILTAIQNSKLESNLKLQVFDRYQIILQIFHDHAHTNEAKLQLALAEIPYLRVKLCGFSHTGNSSTFQGMEHGGGDGENFMQVRRRLLKERELKLKKELVKIKNQRDFLRRSETRTALPVIAVVGYTNCGKTTLIKSLTNDSQLLPQDKLFATLDVTLHSCLLPSNQKALFIDTVGFISDVPTSLIQSFRSTLEEINLADLVIHVRDISHPNTEIQKKTVLKTLQELNLSPKLFNSIIEVRNKIDLLPNLETIEDDSEAISISATEGTGLPNLLEVVEQKVFENTGHSVVLLRIPNGGQEYRWLLKEAALRDAMADPKDENYLIVEVVITSPDLEKFKHLFGDLSISIESLSQ